MLYHNPRPTWLYILLKAYFKVATPIKKFYYFVFRPKTNGVKMIAINKDRILLLRIDYGSKKWTIPGGMVDRGEDGKEAARREIKEESGLEVGEIEFVGSLYSEQEFKRDTVKYFVAKTDNDDLTIDDEEIIDARWFAFDELPDDRASRVDDGIKLYNDWKHGKN